MKDSGNRQRSLSDYKGEIVFLNFWASWCPPCRQELPELNRLAAEYRGRKLRVVAINVDQSRESAQASLKKIGLASSKLEILYDPRSKAVSAYDIESMPASFLIDSNGVVRSQFVGFRPTDPLRWRQEIEKLK